MDVLMIEIFKNTEKFFEVLSCEHESLAGDMKSEKKNRREHLLVLYHT